MTLTVVQTKPRYRSECKGGPRPCPWVGCRYHLYLDIKPNGRDIQLNHPDKELEDMCDTCSLDVADRGPHTQEAVAPLLGVNDSRIDQIEKQAMARFGARFELGTLAD